MSRLISIIVPVYKVADLLPRCVDSVLAQTYSDWELILVDDGSPDNSGDICEDYAKRDSRIHVIHKPNGGLSDARNAGIPTAKGRYLTFLDSDDWINERYLENLLQILDESDADVSACNFLRTATESLPERTEEPKTFSFTSRQALDHIIHFGAFHEQMVVAWGKLYKAELFEGIRYPVGRIHEDEFTTYKLLDKAGKIAFTTEPLLYYWQRADSIMGEGFKLKNKLDYLDALKERAAYFHAYGQSDYSDKSYRSLFTESLAAILTLDAQNDADGKKAVIEKLAAARQALKASGKPKLNSLYAAFLAFPNVATPVYKVIKTIKK